MNLYAIVAGFILALTVGFAGGWKTESWRNDAIELERTRAENRSRLNMAEHGDAQAVAHEDFKAKEEIRYVTRTKVVDRIVERPVYRNVCIDDDGLRVLNDAIAGREPPGELAATVPAATAAP